LVGAAAATLRRRHPVSASTVTACVLRALRIETFFSAEANPSVAAWLRRMAAREVYDQIVAIAQLATVDARGRLEHLLMQLLTKERDSTETDGEVDVLLTRNELAQLIGTTREHVSRLLKEMHDEGVVTRTNSRLKVLRSSALGRRSRLPG
jgi:CRP-like cAMP-binding protein